MSQGREHQRANRLDEAAERYRRVLEAQPAHREAPIRLTEVLEAQGRLGEAITLWEAAIRRSPAAAGLRCALADALHAHGDRPHAITAYLRAVELDPELEAAWWGLGCAQAALNDHADAAESFRRLTALRPDHGLAWQNLGKSWFELGQVDAALQSYRAAAGTLPAEMRCLPLSNIAIAIPGSPTSDPQAILDARRIWAARCLPPTSGSKAFPARLAETHRPLRLGYVSAFFARRNWMKPVWGVLERHDRDRFEVHVFSDGPAPDPAHGFRFHPRDHFHDVNGVSNARLAQRIEDHEIDILVDLNSFSWPARMPLFALRPAPVQIAWFALFATSGTTCYDGLVGDAHVVAAGEEIFYTEKILRVPGSYMTFQVPYPVPDVVPPPSLKRGYLTFGCLAPQYKITTEVVQAWSRILRECPGTRLVLKNAALAQVSGRRFLCELFQRCAIPADRLDLDGPEEHFAFLARYGDIDVALDTFPYNGGTTTTEALWQGVPVLTFAGDRWVARISASLLREAGLAEFVAPDVDGFVARAIALAHDPGTPARLDALRHTLRGTLRASPVCDIAGLTQNLEEIYISVSRALGGKERWEPDA
jgi:predicted O-linked N-acetylglucosamine transferase (SPINDLY family)